MSLDFYQTISGLAGADAHNAEQREKLARRRERIMTGVAVGFAVLAVAAIAVLMGAA